MLDQYRLNYRNLPFAIPLTEHTWDCTPYRTSQRFDLEDDPYEGYLVITSRSDLLTIIDSTKGKLFGWLITEILEPGTINQWINPRYLPTSVICHWNILVYCLLQYTYRMGGDFDINEYFLPVYRKVQYLLSQMDKPVMKLDEAPVIWNYFKAKLDYFMDNYGSLFENKVDLYVKRRKE
jgi:hypothetical protein